MGGLKPHVKNRVEAARCRKDRMWHVVLFTRVYVRAGFTLQAVWKLVEL